MDDGKPLKFRSKDIPFRFRRIGELNRKIDMDLLKVLKYREYVELDQGPAEKFLVLLCERATRPAWKPLIAKYISWFHEAYPKSTMVKTEVSGAEIIMVPKGEETVPTRVATGMESSILNGGKFQVEGADDGDEHTTSNDNHQDASGAGSVGSEQPTG